MGSTKLALNFWQNRAAKMNQRLSLAPIACCGRGDRYRGAVGSTRFLDRGIELMRQGLDDARAKANV